MAVTLRLAPLSQGQSRELLRRLGLDSPAQVESLARWAMGSPLALVVAARAAQDAGLGGGGVGGAEAPAHADGHANGGGAGVASDAAAAAEPGAVDPRLLDELVERIAGDALGREDGEILRAASIAGSADAELLAAILPERDGARSLARLVELDFVERLGDRAIVHALIAKAVSERLRIDDPQLARTLTMRAASHLRDRAADGDASALADLADLVRDPALRNGLGPAFSERYYADRLRPGDHETARGGVAAGLWPQIEPWLRARPDDCHVARSRGGECAGLGVASGLSILDDELCRPLLELAARLEQPARAVVSPFQLAFVAEQGEDRAELTRFLNAVAVARCGVPNPRYDLVNDIGWTEHEREVALRYGYRELPELRRAINGHEVRTWFADAGGGGLVGLVYGAIAAENGIETSPEAGWAEVAIAALESFYDDAALASLPVAPHGYDQAAAAEIVRAQLRDIVARALAADDELRAIVEARYLTPNRSHEGAMRATFQSRSSYYRKLRRAREAIVAACRAQQQG